MGCYNSNMAHGMPSIKPTILLLFFLTRLLGDQYIKAQARSLEMGGPNNNIKKYAKLSVRNNEYLPPQWLDKYTTSVEMRGPSPSLYVRGASPEKRQALETLVQ